MPLLRLPSGSLKDLEEKFAGRAMAWIGGLALVAAAVFFLSLAFSRGWITEPMRVLIGLVVGSAAFAGGAAIAGCQVRGWWRRTNSVSARL